MPLLSGIGYRQFAAFNLSTQDLTRSRKHIKVLAEVEEYVELPAPKRKGA